MHINYEWDEDKRRSNLAKHRVDFESAAAFVFETAIVRIDGRVEYGESRTQAIGLIGQRVHVMVFTMRGDAVRIISLRKANKRETATWQSYQT